MKKKNQSFNANFEIPGFAEDFHIYPLGRDIDGEKKSLKDLQKILLEMTLCFDALCRKNSIEYALCFGSALGLCNYGGFIPWDDDVDIAINYADLPRLIEVLKKELPDIYYFDCYENDHRYNVLLPTLKIRYKNSYIKEKNDFVTKNRCPGSGLFIDIWTFMGVPEDHHEHTRIVKQMRKYIVPYFLKDVIFHTSCEKMKEKIKAKEKEVAEKYATSSMMSQSIAMPFEDIYTRPSVRAYPRNVLYPFKEYDFHGHRLYSFNDIYAFCEIKYGPKCFNVFNGEKWVSTFPWRKRKGKHIARFSLTHSKPKKRS